MCNICGLNNSAKQDDVICWHKDMNNLVSIFMESKLKGKVHPWLTNKFDGVWVFIFSLDSGSLSIGVLIVINSSLAKHVCKVFEVPGRLLFIKLLFKNKLSVSILGLYAGVSSVVQFSQTGEINSLIAKAINKSFFVVLSGDFNENAIKMFTWANSRGVMKTINYIFVSPNLVNFLVHRSAVSVSVGLDSLLDTHLFSLCKQANKNHWKFDLEFKDAITANTTMFSGAFGVAVKFSDLGTMWNVIHKIMVLSTGGAFKKKWFKGFDTVRNKVSSRFHKLELLVSKLVKASYLSSSVSFALLLGTWNNLDSAGASTVRSMFFSGAKFDDICSALAKARKLYCSSKLLESKCTEEFHIRQAITNRMESFELDKSHIIRSVLEWSFHKVVLDHLVMDNELVLEPDLVKSKVNAIMKKWTRKHMVVDDISNTWSCQYQPLDYVFDDAFSEVMSKIDFDELYYVITNLPDKKAAGLLGIFNKLWKHCDKSVLGLLLVFLNSCLFCELGVFTNTCFIALIKTACKILSKILLDKILLACSSYNVLSGNNFSVLKGITTQSPIFVVGLVIEDALEKNQELWLSLVRIKMCSKFVCFFGSIHRDRINCVITDFGLTDGYQVFDGLNQSEVFFSLLWHIFYDSFLCEVKHQKNVYSYRLNSYFVSGNGHTESQAGFSTSLLLAATQHILNIASEFFQVNDILINNNKTVVILINSRVSVPSFFISGSPIFVAHRGEPHQYFSIFLLTESLSKSSLAKAHSNVCLFTNLVLRKVVLDKQFLYLVLAVFHPIIGYRMQFSSISVSGLKLKAGFPIDFPSDTIYHPSFYGLKSFLQCQSESKDLGASVQSHNLQVLYWQSIYPLISPACIYVSVSNNFLAGIVCILLDCNLSLGGSLTSAFQFHDGIPMFVILGKSLFFKFLPSRQCFGIAFMDQLRDHHGVVFSWCTFKWWKKLDLCGQFLNSLDFLLHFLQLFIHLPQPQLVLALLTFVSDNFVAACSCFSQIDIDSLSVYTNGSLKNLGTVDCRAGATVFFEDIDLGLGVSVQGLVLSTLAELQAIALALKCVPAAHSIDLFSDSQAALDACRSELSLVCPDFHNQCWVKHWHIQNVIHSKNLRVSWHKVKDHSGISENDCADSIADVAFLSGWYFPSCVDGHFLLVDGSVVSGNFRHFVRDVYHAVCHACWEVGSSSGFLASSLHSDHPDLNMATGFTSRLTADTRTYLMKALHHQLSVAVQKHIYNKCYPSVLCLYCGKRSLSGLSLPSSVVLQLISTCALDLLVSLALYKNFVFNGWLQKAVTVFHDSKVAGVKITDFMHSLCSAFRNNIWLVCTKHRAFIEKNGLISVDKFILIPVFGLVSRLLPGVIKLLGVTKAFGVLFGFRKSCLFFSDIGNIVSVNIVI
ncbi:hypothetical protein G9A89_000034 [Geosiphon pyriformis]|nr:hypothetical protein G9A89_000034 [Geosiphon pyriformis]